MEAHLSSSCTWPAGQYREMLRRRLADSTRRIQWTYSIFWSFCPEQQVLVWGEGYLNGADSTQLSLRRSQQLRILFNAMDVSRAGVRPASSEINTVTLPPSAGNVSVTPQDLTPMEWFYVGSMACVFATGDGLPGRALVGRGPVWQCITTEGDTRVFVRARLVQRACLQTIVCIPASDGVIEFGTTALVEQDANLLQQMQSMFLEQPMHPTFRISSSTRAREIQAVGEMRTSRAFKRWEAMAAAAPHRQEFLRKHRQRMLKTALLTIPRLYAVKREVHVEAFPTRVTTSVQNSDEGQNSRGSRVQSKHVMAERRRREELNDRFVKLRRLVPVATKPNKVSLLGDAIEYVIDLKRRVAELESTAKSLKKPIKQDVEVTVEKSMAMMKISCAWQDDLLIDILQKIVDLQLEVVDANAKVSDDTLNARLKAKVRSSDLGNGEKKTAEIQAALLHVIEGKVRGKSVI